MARILVVDDDDLVRETIAQILQGAGHDLLEASNGRQALDLLDRETIDLVISDILMPEIDGIGLLLGIRKRFPHVNVLCISGGNVKGDRDYLEAAEKLGARMTLSKPFTPKQLLAAAEAAMSKVASPESRQRQPHS